MFLFSCDGNLSLGCIRIDLKVFGSFESDLYVGMLTYSCKFLTEARNMLNRDEDIFLDFQASIWIYYGSQQFLFRLFDHAIWVVIFKMNSMELVHFFSLDFRSGTNIFSSINLGMDNYFLVEIQWLEFKSR